MCGACYRLGNTFYRLCVNTIIHAEGVCKTEREPEAADSFVRMSEPRDLGSQELEFPLNVPQKQLNVPSWAQNAFPEKKRRKGGRS